MSKFKQLRTKEQVTIGDIERRKAIVYIKIENVLFDGVNYAATTRYYTRDYYNKVDYNVNTLKLSSPRFPIKEADYLESILDVQGETTSERLIDIIPKIALWEAGASENFGLTSDDFEYFDEEIDTKLEV